MAKLSELKKYLNYEFSSGCYTGEDYKSFQTKYINYLKAMCKENHWQLVNVGRNHYCFSAFIQSSQNKFVYISISDVRYFSNEWYDHILLYRLGDFYEVFGNNAVTLSDELGLTLTGRDFGLTSRIPMIGFPYHAADNYFTKIVPKHKVANAETKDDIRLLPEEEDNYDDLTEEEMREFDGDIEEPQNLDDEPEDGFDASAFDKTAVVALVEIFGDKLSVR